MKFERIMIEMYSQKFLSLLLSVQRKNIPSPLDVIIRLTSRNEYLDMNMEKAQTQLLSLKKPLQFLRNFVQ